MSLASCCTVNSKMEQQLDKGTGEMATASGLLSEFQAKHAELSKLVAEDGRWQEVIWFLGDSWMVIPQKFNIDTKNGNFSKESSFP